MLKIALCDDESLFLKRERSVLASFLEQEGIEFKIDKYIFDKRKAWKASFSSYRNNKIMFYDDYFVHYVP